MADFEATQTISALPADVRATRQAWTVLFLLVCVYSFSWVDRSLLIILIDPLSKDLKVSNTEIGLLTGFGSSLLYSLAGFPIARLADKGSRRIIITVAVGVWSLLTAFSGFASNFVSLALTRFGIAISSAGCSPAAYSLISDYFPQKRRGTAIAIYSLGISIGMWAGLTFGGILEDHMGWRVAFMILGFPGVLLAVLFFCVVKEPKRGQHDVETDGGDRQFTLKEATSHILRHPCFVAIAIGFSLLAAANSAFENWIPTYMIRVNHMSSSEVGSISGLFQGVTGFGGTLLFGFLADRLGSRDSRWYLWLPILGFLIMGGGIILFFMTSGHAMYACYFFIELSASAFYAPLFTASQALLPPRLRALGMATVLFLLNLIGMGAGPFVAGWMSDQFTANGYRDGLAPAISLMQLSGVIGLCFLSYASLRIRRALPNIS
jgi:predicted MFS family arabinose efflux permease